MRNYLLSILLLTTFICKAQPTDVLQITGKVKSIKNYTLDDLKKFKSVDLRDINTSCSSKEKEMALNVKGVLLKNILDSVTYDYENPKNLNSFYFLFTAADGYKVVFSFNEIYNTETGNQLYIVVGKDGRPVEEMTNRILLLTLNDIKTGKRNIKNLNEIKVCMSE